MRGALPDGRRAAARPTDTHEMLDQGHKTAATTPPRGPERLGRYELVTRLGAGALAEVFLARQPAASSAEKVAVIHRIHPHLARVKEFVEVLLDEARAAALLEHPRVVDIYDLGVARGVYFIAMEYLAGQTLEAVLDPARRGDGEPIDPIDPIATARIVADAAEGLHAAHGLRSLSGRPLDLVHRDVCPRTVVVLYDGGVKLVDFGVARARALIAGAAGQETAPRGRAGYASPEQAAGQTLDRRSDVYSLGVVMWEALALRRLFDSAQAVTDPPAPPSTHRSEVPAELDRICLRALALDPGARFQTAAEMHAEIESFLRGAGFRRDAGAAAAFMGRAFGAERDAGLALVRRARESEPPLARGSEKRRTGPLGLKEDGGDTAIDALARPSGPVPDGAIASQGRTTSLARLPSGPAPLLQPSVPLPSVPLPSPASASPVREAAPVVVPPPPVGPERARREVPPPRQAIASAPAASSTLRGASGSLTERGDGATEVSEALLEIGEGATQVAEPSADIVAALARAAAPSTQPAATSSPGPIAEPATQVGEAPTQVAELAGTGDTTIDAEPTDSGDASSRPRGKGRTGRIEAIADAWNDRRRLPTARLPLPAPPKAAGPALAAGAGGRANPGGDTEDDDDDFTVVDPDKSPRAFEAAAAIAAALAARPSALPAPASALPATAPVMPASALPTTAPVMPVPVPAAAERSSPILSGYSSRRIWLAGLVAVAAIGVFAAILFAALEGSSEHHRLAAEPGPQAGAEPAASVAEPPATAAAAAASTDERGAGQTPAAAPAGSTSGEASAAKAAAAAGAPGVDPTRAEATRTEATGADAPGVDPSRAASTGVAPATTGSAPAHADGAATTGPKGHSGAAGSSGAATPRRTDPARSEAGSSARDPRARTRPATPAHATREPKVTRRPVGARPDDLYREGARLYLAGKLDQARRKFESALAASPRFAPAHRGLGLVFERTGETSLAIRSLQTYLRLAPGAPDVGAIRARLDRLRR